MGRTDSASRLIEASPDRVYAALVDPDALADWLPPSGMTGSFDHFDATPGGVFRMILTYADAPGAGGKSSVDSDVVEGRFIEIVPRVRVVQAIEFVSDEPHFAGTMTMTWSMAKADGGTRVDVVADDVPPGISAGDHAAGMNSSLANLAAYLDRGPRSV